MLSLAALLVAAAASAPAPETVLPLPFAVLGAAPDWTGVALGEAMLDALAQSTQDNFVTLKQLDAVLRRSDLEIWDPHVSPRAKEWAAQLGATELVVGSVAVQGNKLQIEARLVRLADSQTIKSARAQGPLAMLPQLEVQLARGLFGKAEARTSSATALEMEARCFSLVARQSLAPRSRSLLKDDRLQGAEARCADALAADPRMSAAHAEKSVLLGARNQMGPAIKEAKVAQSAHFSWLAPLAEAWVERRRGSVAGARATLENALASHPGFLHALGYLGEEELDTDDAAAALATFDRYLERSPGNPWAIGMRANALAKLGRIDEAIEQTKIALDTSPDPELKIELASRYIDKGDDATAEKILLAVAEEKPTRPRAFLRLGYLSLRAKKFKEARSQFLRAVSEATRPDEARIRALAYADLAQVAGSEAIYDNAIEALEAARREGLRKLPCKSPELVKWKGKPEFELACSDVGAPPPGTAVDDEDEVVSVELQ